MIEWFGPIFVESYGGSGERDAVPHRLHRMARRTADRSAVPAPPFEVVVLDESDEPVPAGEVGVLGFRAPEGRGPRYHADPEKTAKAYIAPGVFTLGDVGYVDDDGYVYITDRIADMVVSGGVNLYPAESEKVLATHPAVAQVAVIGVPHPDLGRGAAGADRPGGRAAGPGRARGLLPASGSRRTRCRARTSSATTWYATRWASSTRRRCGRRTGATSERSPDDRHRTTVVGDLRPVRPGSRARPGRGRARQSRGRARSARRARTAGRSRPDRADIARRVAGRRRGGPRRGRSAAAAGRSAHRRSRAPGADQVARQHLRRRFSGCRSTFRGSASPPNRSPLSTRLVGSDGAIYDVFAAVIRYVGEHGAGIPGDDFADAEYTASTLPERVKAYLELSSAEGFPFPDDPAEQLARAATAMRRRWASPRARRSRRGQGLPDDLPLAFHVQAVRVGPPRHPDTGSPRAVTRLPARSRPPARSAAGCAAARRTTGRVSRWTRCPVAETSAHVRPAHARTAPAGRRAGRVRDPRRRDVAAVRAQGGTARSADGHPARRRTRRGRRRRRRHRRRSRSARRIWRVCCTPSCSSPVGRPCSAAVCRPPWAPPSGGSR